MVQKLIKTIPEGAWIEEVIFDLYSFLEGIQLANARPN